MSGMAVPESPKSLLTKCRSVAGAFKEHWGWVSAALTLIGFVVNYIHTTRYADRLGIKVRDLDMTTADHLFAAAKTAILMAATAGMFSVLFALGLHVGLVWWSRPGVSGRMQAVLVGSVPSVPVSVIFVNSYYGQGVSHLPLPHILAFVLVAVLLFVITALTSLALSALLLSLFTDYLPLDEPLTGMPRLSLGIGLLILGISLVSWFNSPRILADAHVHGHVSASSESLFIFSGAVTADLGRFDDGTCALRLAPRVYVIPDVAIILIGDDDPGRVVVYGSQPTFTLDKSCTV